MPRLTKSELARHRVWLSDWRTPVDMAMGVGGRGRAGGPPPVYEKTAALIKRLAAESTTATP